MNPALNLPTCPKCAVPLGPGAFNLGRLAPCPNCRAQLWLEVFGALFRPIAKGSRGEAVLIEGESSCFYHDRKKATVVCDACGRFLCGLCDCQFNGGHYCPPCLESGAKNRGIEQLEKSRPLYGRQALLLALLPLFVTGLGALFLVLRHWNTPGSLVAPQRWLMPTALVLASLQTLLFVLLIARALLP